MTKSPTLNQFFQTRESLSDKKVARIVRGEELDSVKAKIAQGLKDVRLPRVFYEMMIRQVVALLDIDVSDILIGAWRLSDELREFFAERENLPGEAAYLPLADHTVVSEHLPSLCPVVNGKELEKIGLSVQFEMRLSGVLLKIQDGRIMEVAVRSCRGKGFVAFAGIRILERQTGTFPWPSGAIRLGKGVPIRRRSAEARDE